MFNRKERLQLIETYGREDALARYTAEAELITAEELKRYRAELISDFHHHCAVDDATCFIDYCYTHHTDNFDDIVDWLHTLRAIQRQIEG
ncbi:hypothetical protein [Macrococcus equipercicus]|uniref:Uncharacterized protein n=1 Tax=Macrococcus equipercicus TaxID=69967 RepID=A0A9Q9BQF2_9STAP|nr:hypothetical protein [Macrococcus equipercicus]KAA1039288.1 hypothetical protein ERX35_006870 [Macrococcus equipercicus]UTH13579.1 hypothetical protein KFV11_10195 [Macrococcus equipercicus]